MSTVLTGFLFMLGVIGACWFMLACLRAYLRHRVNTLTQQPTQPTRSAYLEQIDKCLRDGYHTCGR